MRIVELPMPSPVGFDGQRLPASYANFYVGNAACWRRRSTTRPTAGRSASWPTCSHRRVVGIHAVDLVLGLGTLHCMTQQEPA